MALAPVTFKGPKEGQKNTEGSQEKEEREGVEVEELEPVLQPEPELSSISVTLVKF